MGRNATGVRGMVLDDGDDEVVGMVCVNDRDRETVLVVSDQGYGKRSVVDDYRITNRGGKGVRTLNITDKTGRVVAIKSVTEDQDLMIINKSGITLRLRVADIRQAGRATQGVRLIDLKKAQRCDQQRVPGAHRRRRGGGNRRRHRTARSTGGDRHEPGGGRG